MKKKSMKIQKKNRERVSGRMCLVGAVGYYLVVPMVQLPGVLAVERSHQRPFPRTALIPSPTPTPAWHTSNTNMALQRSDPLASLQDISEEPPSSRAPQSFAEASAASQSDSPSAHPASLGPSQVLFPRLALPTKPTACKSTSQLVSRELGYHLYYHLPEPCSKSYCALDRFSGNQALYNFKNKSRHFPPLCP